MPRGERKNKDDRYITCTCGTKILPTSLHMHQLSKKHQIKSLPPQQIEWGSFLVHINK